MITTLSLVVVGGNGTLLGFRYWLHERNAKPSSTTDHLVTSSAAKNCSSEKLHNSVNGTLTVGCYWLANNYEEE